MDEYAGRVFEPVSLHKYLYANVNPVMYSDPSGYSSLSEMITATAIQGVLSGISTAVIRIATFIGEGGSYSDISWGSLILESIGWGIVGSMFGVAGWYANFVKSAAIMMVLGFSSKADTIRKNAQQGRDFEKQEFSKFKEKYNNAVEQVTIKTASGTRTRVDAIGLDSNGNVVIYEFKSSSTSPLTNNQANAFPEIFESGGTVVGKGIFKGGYKVPEGTKIEIIRP